MDAREVVRRRLAANGLAGPLRSGPVDVVRHLLAVQSQDVHPSAWSIGSRCAATEDDVERARADGEVVRTHVLRTTWHDVAAGDLRWLLALTAERVRAQTVAACREVGVTQAVRSTARRALDAALPGRHLTRAEVLAVLQDVGLSPDGRALSHLLMQLELDGQLCSGTRVGAAQTYALLDERVPPAPAKDHRAAVAELVLRFLTGHGPATVRDLSWWASLLVRDVRAALHDLGDEVRRSDVDGLELWSARDAPDPAGPTGVQLVQLYDEHLVAFTESKHLSDPQRTTSARTLAHLAVVLHDGQLAGSWRRVVRSGSVLLEVQALRPLPGIERAAEAYGRFVGLPVEVRTR